MSSMRRFAVVFVALAAAEAAAQHAPTGKDAHDFVLVLHDSAEATLKDLLAVFRDKLGVAESSAMPLVQRINDQGSSVVLMGPEASCKAIAEHFEVRVHVMCDTKATDSHPPVHMCSGNQDPDNRSPEARWRRESTCGRI